MSGHECFTSYDNILTPILNCCCLFDEIYELPSFWWVVKVWVSDGSFRINLWFLIYYWSLPLCFSSNSVCINLNQVSKNYNVFQFTHCHWLQRHSKSLPTIFIALSVPMIPSSSTHMMKKVVCCFPLAYLLNRLGSVLLGKQLQPDMTALALSGGLDRIIDCLFQMLSMCCSAEEYIV
jgi:hypothetical protein